MKWKIQAYRFIEKTFGVEGYKDIESAENYIHLTFNRLYDFQIILLGKALTSKSNNFYITIVADKDILRLSFTEKKIKKL